jgi:hypothetical protein
VPKNEVPFLLSIENIVKAYRNNPKVVGVFPVPMQQDYERWFQRPQSAESKNMALTMEEEEDSITRPLGHRLPYQT